MNDQGLNKGGGESGKEAVRSQQQQFCFSYVTVLQ